MKEMYLLYIIPVVLLELVYGQVVVISPTEKKVATGIDVSVTCKLETSAPSENTVYHWFDKNGNEVTNRNMGLANKLVLKPFFGTEQRMLIRDVNDDRAGVYKCVVTVNDQEFKGEFKLETYAPITFSSCPLQQHAVLGDEGQVNCKVHASESTINTWYRSAGSGTVTLTQGNVYRFELSGLIIMNVTREHGGEYMLNSEPRTTDTLLTPEYRVINLDIYEKPVIINPIIETTANVDDEASMYCRASGVPTPTYKWFKEGSTNELTNTERLTVSQNNDQGILTFHPVKREDQGRYICRAYVADIGMAESSNVMTVQTPPVIKDMRNETGMEHKSMGIVCEAHGEPAPTLQWVKVSPGTQYNPGFSSDGISVTREDINDPDNPGTRLRLDFGELSYTNAGFYKCTAQNSAGRKEKAIYLEVLFPPKFTNQPDGPFYNWKGNTDGHLPCVTEANPQPVFSWFKGDRKITDATNYFSIVNSKGPEQHAFTSKLMITYNGGNDNDVFGDFKCVAANTRADSEQILTMEKAVVPGNPTVMVERYSATYIELALQAPVVLGPPVTQFKTIVTQNHGVSADGPKELWVERETRTFTDDRPNPRTKLLIEKLTPRTEYVIAVYAKNSVGLGSPVEVPVSTRAISAPGIVKIITPLNSEYSNEILVQWTEPDDGGQAILAYRVEYRRVKDMNVTLGNDVTEKWYGLDLWITATSTVKPGNKQYTLRNLVPGQFYQIRVKAENSMGTSIPEPRVIKTKTEMLNDPDSVTIAEFAPGATTENLGGLSTGVIIIIVVVIFLILFVIVDVICCFKNNCGILMLVRQKVFGNRTEEGYSVAKTDDVENLAKKDQLDDAKSAEEADAVHEDAQEKKAPLLSSEEQNVDTVDECDTGNEAVKELEPEDKDAVNLDSPSIQAPTENAKEDNKEEKK